MLNLADLNDNGVLQAKAHFKAFCYSNNVWYISSHALPGKKNKVVEIDSYLNGLLQVGAWNAGLCTICSLAQ